MIETESSPSPVHAADASVRALLDGVGRFLAAGVRATAFWVAVLLPFVVFLALATGVGGRHPTAVVGLVGANAVCAVVGHGHGHAPE